MWRRVNLVYPEDGGDTFLRNVVFTQDLHGTTSQKTACFVVTAVKTSNLTSVLVVQLLANWMAVD
jgi:hypothetical protein